MSTEACPHCGSSMQGCAMSGLSEQEKESLRGLGQGEYVAAVEAIVAARDARVQRLIDACPTDASIPHLCSTLYAAHDLVDLLGLRADLGPGDAAIRYGRWWRAQEFSRTPALEDGAR